MIRLQSIRVVLWAMVGAASLALVALTTDLLPAGSSANTSAPQIAEIGGPFQLTTHGGETLTAADLAGRPHAVFFGFTNCPDVCPTTLYVLSELLDELGSAADEITPIFITVDPERDTQEVLAQYMEAFDPRIIALTGTVEETTAAADAYKAYFQRQPLEGGGYTMDHTSVVYLMNSDGEFVGTLDFHEPQEVQLGKLRLLLEG